LNGPLPIKFLRTLRRGARGMRLCTAQCFLLLTSAEEEVLVRKKKKAKQKLQSFHSFLQTLRFYWTVRRLKERKKTISQDGIKLSGFVSLVCCEISNEATVLCYAIRLRVNYLRHKFQANFFFVVLKWQLLCDWICR